MPRFGQPGALFFDNANVTEFLRRWNIECEDYGLTDIQKCIRLPDYCTAKTKDVIEILDGYKQNNWTKLQEELKGLFWQYDQHKDTLATLNELIHEAPNTDLTIFVLRYTAITESLVTGNEMSLIQRVRRFFDGLPADLREKALEYCIKQKWKLSSHDTGITDPDFDLLKKFVLEKAEIAKRKVVYNKERAIEGGFGEPNGSATSIKPPTYPTSSLEPSVISLTVVPAPATTPVSAPDPIAELTKQVALLIQANMQTPKLTSTATNATARPPPRCIWCDSTEHIRRSCPELPLAIQKGLIRFNDKNRIVNATTGQELPPNYSRGGMKILVQ
jgi:hypothetical protein